MTNKEMTSEQTSETPVEDASVDIAVEETVVEETPEVETTTNGTTDKSINYLDPQLFSDIRTISRQEIEEAEINEDVADKLKNKYENSLAEISENQVIKGRGIGMNDHVILIDIGFKSEGLVRKEEFETLPIIGDPIRVFIVNLEDHKGHFALSKEKAVFLERWNELKEAFNKEILSANICIETLPAKSWILS